MKFTIVSLDNPPISHFMPTKKRARKEKQLSLFLFIC